MACKGLPQNVQQPYRSLLLLNSQHILTKDCSSFVRTACISSFGNTSEPNPTQLVSFSIQVRKPNASEILSFHDVKVNDRQTRQPLVRFSKEHLSPHLASLLVAVVVETYPGSEYLSDRIPKLEILEPQVVQAQNLQLAALAIAFVDA